ncbi:hypothetical protein ACFX16_009425 [Malus domestica]
MGTSVQVTLLCGVYNENPLSYLVPIDGFNFLINYGWNDHFDPSFLQPLSRVASTVDAVLLSYPNTLHLCASVRHEAARPVRSRLLHQARLPIRSPHYAQLQDTAEAVHQQAKKNMRGPRSRMHKTDLTRGYDASVFALGEI